VPLFQNSDVRRALDLTDTQVDRLVDAQTRSQKDYENQFARVGSLAAGNRVAELQKLRTGQQDEFFRSAAGILSPEQLRRYRQLDYQYQGPGAFSSPDLREKMKLTDNQVQRLQELQNQSMYAFSSLLQDSRGRPDEALARYNNYRRQLAEKIAGILNPQQRGIWKELTGEPFPFRYTFGSAITAANNW